MRFLAFHLSAMLQCKVFAGDICFSFVYTLLVCFTRFFTSEQMSGNNQTEWKMVNVSDWSVSCRLITKSHWTKVFAERISLCVSCRYIFFAEATRSNMSQEYACKVSKLFHFRSWSCFQKKVVQRWWRDVDAVRPRKRPPSLEALAFAMNFMACPWPRRGFSGVSAARSRLCAKTTPVTLASTPARIRVWLRCRREVRVSDVKSSCDRRSDFLRSLSMRFFSPLCWPPKGKN